jgi:hypothetical protein
METLRKCPFCGGEADYEQVGSFAMREGCAWSVGCRDEACIGFQSVTTFARKAEAAAAWNTRTAPQWQPIEGAETFDTVRAWCDETFGPATPDSIINRAAEEWIEMTEAPDDESRAIEAADVVIILCRMPGFVEAFQKKMAVNRARKWRLTGNGTGYHIPTPPAQGAPDCE